MSDNRMTMADHQAKATREEHRRIDAFVAMVGEQKAAAEAEEVIGCSCQAGLGPSRSHAADCPVHTRQADLIDPYDGGSWIPGKAGGVALNLDDARNEIARLSAALSVALAQLEEERARNAARQEPVAWMFPVGTRVEFTTNPNKAKSAQALGYGPQALAIIPGDAS